MEDRNVAGFQRRGDLIEASVGAAEHGLVPQPHTCAFELADARRQARGFIVERFETANLSTARPDAAVRLERQSQHALGGAHPRCDGDEAANDLFCRTIVDPELVNRRARIVPTEADHILRRGAAEPVDRLPCVADHPQPAAVTGDQFQETGARAIDVLVFIDEHVAMPQLHGDAHGFIRFK